jgi:hypothetical protein
MSKEPLIESDARIAEGIFCPTRRKAQAYRDGIPSIFNAAAAENQPAERVS